MKNRIFCTFIEEEEIGSAVDTVRFNYSVLYRKVFVLSTDTGEFVITYNLEPNISRFPKKTIYVHRKKLTNTLYTINALNLIVQSLPGTDKIVDWQKYRNCLLLIRNAEFTRLKTKLYKVIEW